MLDEELSDPLRDQHGHVCPFAVPTARLPIGYRDARSDPHGWDAPPVTDPTCCRSSRATTTPLRARRPRPRRSARSRCSCASDPDGWPYYARPRLGLDRTIGAADGGRRSERDRSSSAPPRPSSGSTRPLRRCSPRPARPVSPSRGCPLLPSPAGSMPPSHPGDRRSARILGADDPDLPAALGAVGAGFAGPGRRGARVARSRSAGMATGLLRVAAAFDDHGDVVGGGSHGPRGTTSPSSPGSRSPPRPPPRRRERR